MNGAEQVRQVLTEKLKAAGLAAVPAWDRSHMPALQDAVASVGVCETETNAAALWNYLGEHWSDRYGTFVETYGRRLHMELSVDLYAPKGKRMELERCCDAVETLCLAPLCEGIRCETVRRGEIGFDRASGYLHCRCTLSALANFTATRVDESALLTDFTLKGVLK